jgi:type VII secretion-associated protein (TIGR03931 family)
VRVAVQAGASAVRVARRGPDGVARVVEVPAEPGVPVALLLRGLVDGDVVPVGGDGPAVLLAAGRSVLVVDVGAAATVVSRVHGGRVVARRTAPGGERFDRAVAALLVARDRAWAGDPALLGEARRVREALSLRPQVRARAPEVGGSPGVTVASRAGPRGGAARSGGADGPSGALLTCAEVGEVLGGPWDGIVAAATAVAGPRVPVLLAGGGARSPDLAGRLDAAGFTDVTVLRRPDAAAVLAALGPPDRDPLPARAASRWLPPPPRRARRPWRTGLALAAAAVLLGALHLVGRLLVPAAPDLPAGVLAQYGYRFAVPDGWAHTGGLPERRRSLLTPVGAPAGSDLIAVESTPLGYDADAEPERAAAELRAAFDAAGPGLSAYDPAARVAGRAVTAYRERDGATEVRWYVVLEGGTQLSVGCRHTAAGEAFVLAACERVVASLRG